MPGRVIGWKGSRGWGGDYSRRAVKRPRGNYDTKELKAERKKKELYYKG